MTQSTSNPSSDAAYRFDAAAQRASPNRAKQSTRVLIRVPHWPASSHAHPADPIAAATADNETTGTEHQGSTSADHRFRIDAAHSDKPSPHTAALAWLENRTDLLGGLLGRKSLLAIALVTAALATAVLQLTSRSHPAASQSTKHQPDAQARVIGSTSSSHSTPTIVRASDAPPPTTAPAAISEQSVPPPNWNIPAAANLPASINDSAAHATDVRPIELARREPPLAPTTTDLQPASGQRGVATFAGVIDKPPSPPSQ